MVQEGRQGGPLRKGRLYLNLLDERVCLRPSEKESRRNARAEARAGGAPRAPPAERARQAGAPRTRRARGLPATAAAGVTARPAGRRTPYVVKLSFCLWSLRLWGHQIPSATLLKPRAHLPSAPSLTERQLSELHAHRGAARPWLTLLFPALSARV